MLRLLQNVTRGREQYIAYWLGLLCEATLLRYVMPKRNWKKCFAEKKNYYLLINFITYHYKPDLEVSVVS